MSRSKIRRKTTPVRRNVRKGGDFQRLHIKVTSPRIVMHQTMSWLIKVSKYGTCLILLSVIAYGGYRGYHHLYKDNQYYRLQAIEVDTNGYLSATRVADLAELKLDKTVFDIDLDEVQKVLTDLPEIEKCDVERRLPGMLKITVTERDAVAWLQCEALGYPGCSDGGVLVDRKGFTFPSGEALWQASRNLPVIVISEARSEDFEHGYQSTHDDLMLALSLMEVIDQAGLRPEWRAVKFDLINEYSIELTSHDGVKAVFGMWDHQRQVKDLISIREHCRDKKLGKIKTMNLIPRINIPVEFEDETQKTKSIPVIVRPKSKGSSLQH
ncbi:MAG: cell division protein FtsQ/DivIB [Akkermansiaceae bacterium]